MLGLRKRLEGAILKLYGEDRESVDGKVEELDKRVEGRRRERVRAGVRADYRRRHTAEEYEAWMNIGEGND